MRFLLVLLVFGALAPPARAEDPSIADGSAQAALDAARARWKERGLVSYRFREQLQCFCPVDITEPRTLTVRRRRPVDPPDHLRETATVPRLFRVVADAIDRRAATLRVRYGRSGLPRRIWIDYDERVADEERGFVASRLRSLE